MPSLFKWRISLLPGHRRNIVPTMLTCNFWGLLFVVDRIHPAGGLIGYWEPRLTRASSCFLQPGHVAKQISRNAIQSQFSSLLCKWGLACPGVVNCLFSVKVAPRILSSVLAIPRARTPYLCHILAYWRICTFLDNRYVNAANGQKQILIIQVFPGGVFKNWVKPMYAWAEGQNRSE